ncbi:AAA family ATPase [Yoonia vestfoldensis]|uniref:Replication factor C small subunit n=1 Tax=Yoonia vestfoldensis TaxID=245188 RepID=A0A1Y0EGQ9_9RHOB|nr:AAA family ATPase [Yoonia vestfoldensis]ARU02785.1 replication factor C small subunit [Yoonia vestfoldensis]
MKITQNPSAWAVSTPQTFSDLVFADEYTRQDLYDYVQYPQMCGNIILEGAYGSGKSTIAAIIAKERLGSTPSVYELNGDAWTDDTLKTLCGTFNLARTCEEIPIVIINEVDRLKDKQYVLRDFLDEHTQRLLVIMTTNHLSNIDGSIVDRSDVFRVRGFEPIQAVAVAQRVLHQYSVAVTDSDLLAIFERSLISDETELSLRQIGRTVDKLVLQLSTTQQPQPRKPKLTVV